MICGKVQQHGSFVVGFYQKTTSKFKFFTISNLAHLSVFHHFLFLFTEQTGQHPKLRFLHWHCVMGSSCVTLFTSLTLIWMQKTLIENPETHRYLKIQRSRNEKFTFFFAVLMPSKYSNIPRLLSKSLPVEGKRFIWRENALWPYWLPSSAEYIIEVISKPKSAREASKSWVS